MAATPDRAGAAGGAHGKKGASDVYLIVDARERSVVPFLDAELQGHAYVLRQVNTGDYLICRAPRGGGAPAILAAIERKTHEDFAASFKDGRHENIKKMRALRAATGCQLYYFIEGPAFPSPNRRFGRIPFGNILAAVTKLMVRDGVFIVQTENESHSAKRLADFLRVYDTETAYVAPRVAGDASGTDASGTDASGTDAGDASGTDAGDASGTDAGDASGTDAGAFTVPDMLTARVEETDGEAAVNVWSRLRGVSIVLGKLLTREFTVAELAAQEVPPDRIRAIKAATGQPINKHAVASLLAVRDGSAEHAAKLVSGLRNISPAVAALLLESAGGLAPLCALPAGALAEVKLPQKTRAVRLGKARAERIRRILNYKEGLPARPAPDVEVPARPASDVEALACPETLACPEAPARSEAPALPDSDVEAILAAAGFG